MTPSIHFQVPILLAILALPWVSSRNLPSGALYHNQRFEVYNGNKAIGFIDISETIFKDSSRIEVRSEIETRLLFRFKALGIEAYHFRNDTLIVSQLYRKVNSRVRLNQKLTKSPKGYLLRSPDFHQTLKIPAVRTNLTRLFLEEPKGLSQVFSDRFGQWVPLNLTNPHQYRVDLPNGSHSVFTYRNGLCVGVTSRGSFYKVSLLPVKR